MLLECFSYFDILIMSTAKVFTLLLFSKTFCCRQSQNIKVTKKTVAVTIPEYNIRCKKTKFCRQQEISLQNNKNTSKDRVVAIYFLTLIFWEC